MHLIKRVVLSMAILNSGFVMANSEQDKELSSYVDFASKKNKLNRDLLLQDLKNKKDESIQKNKEIANKVFMDGLENTKKASELNLEILKNSAEIKELKEFKANFEKEKKAFLKLKSDFEKKNKPVSVFIDTISKLEKKLTRCSSGDNINDDSVGDGNESIPGDIELNDQVGDMQDLSDDEDMLGSNEGASGIDQEPNDDQGIHSKLGAKSKNVTKESQAPIAIPEFRVLYSNGTSAMILYHGKSLEIVSNFSFDGLTVDSVSFSKIVISKGENPYRTLYINR